MRISSRPIEAVAVLALAAVLVWPTETIADHDKLPEIPLSSIDEGLPTDLRLDRSSVAVSGLSSGGFFAHQFHVAYSELVTGAGIVAGGPYRCADVIPNPFWPTAVLDRQSAAVTGCTHLFRELHPDLGGIFWGLPVPPPRAEDSLAALTRARSQGVIDDPAHLADDRVWLFNGSDDLLVPRAVGDALAGLYERLGVQPPRLKVEPNHPQRPAGHGIPVDRFLGESRFDPPPSCAEHRPPFIIECGFEAAELLLSHLYGEGFNRTAADPHAAGTLVPFDQRPFIPASVEPVSMSAVGYLYVPTSCQTGGCRLHVAFHGCRQNVDAVGPDAVHDDFVRDAGYNRWAAANRIVVLYPQLTAAPLNPRRCWDFWGYSSSGGEFYGQGAPQMRAVKAMIDRLLGGPR